LNSRYMMLISDHVDWQWVHLRGLTSKVYHILGDLPAVASDDHFYSWPTIGHLFFC
jgi:hypothetical protein